eukprot:12631157-Alexandrium_andersonii.AAC.1
MIGAIKLLPIESPQDFLSYTAVKTWEAEAANAVDAQKLADLGSNAEAQKVLLDQLKFGLTKSTRASHGAPHAFVEGAKRHLPSTNRPAHPASVRTAPFEP